MDDMDATDGGFGFVVCVFFFFWGWITTGICSAKSTSRDILGGAKYIYIYIKYIDCSSHSWNSDQGWIL